MSRTGGLFIELLPPVYLYQRYSLLGVSIDFPAKFYSYRKFSGSIVMLQSFGDDLDIEDLGITTLDKDKLGPVPMIVPEFPEPLKEHLKVSSEHLQGMSVCFIGGQCGAVRDTPCP